jgi:hypothetical protein
MMSPARTEHHPGQERRVAHEVLQVERQHDDGAEDGEITEKHHQVAGCEAAVAKIDSSTMGCLQDNS